MNVSAGNGETGLWLRTVIESYWPTCVELPYNPGTKYGRVTLDGVTQAAHVLACTARRGPRPTAAHQAAHWCGNPRCVNWRHLRWATQAENVSDRPLEYR